MNTLFALRSSAILAGVAIITATEATLPDPATLSKECFVKLGPLLHTSGGRITPEVRAAYLDWAEQTVLKELRQANQTVPANTLSEAHQDPIARAAMFGSVYPPDPSILQNYAKLRSDFGEKALAKYHSLFIAMAVSKRVKDVQASTKDIGRDYQPGFWTDESLQIPGSQPEKDFIARLADYMGQNHVAALDLYQDPSAQQKLKSTLASQGAPSNFVGEVRKSVQFGERLKNAMILRGQRPAAREPKPAPKDWIRHLIQLNESTPTSTPTQDGKPMPWPLFPIAKAPWPLLMPLAHPVPISEATYMWEAFQGEHGADRYHTYGPYRGDDDVVPDSLKPSKWFWDAWPDRIVHGGMCVPISKGTVDLYSGLGKPAMWAGQPGHANLISFQWVDDAWTAEIEQAFAGGPDVTFAQWYFDEDTGAGLRFRDLYYWAGAEYQLGLALAMNLGLNSYMDSRLAANLYRAMPASDKPTLGVKLLRTAIQANPYNPELWYRLAEQTSDPEQGIALVEAAMKADPGRLIDKPGVTLPDKPAISNASNQYWRTIAQFSAPLTFFTHPAATDETELRKVHAFLKTVPGLDGNDLVNYTEKYGQSALEDQQDGALKTDLRLAEEGDAFGQLRMGERYRDGDGVTPNPTKARELFAFAAAQGDVAAALDWANITPVCPSDQISISASTSFGKDQMVKHLIDGSGLTGAIHDNEGAAKTMWHTTERPTPKPPDAGLAPSPAWARFDFARPAQIDSILIWNHNQEKLTDRGFRKTHLYGTTDGTTWFSLTTPNGVVLPRTSGRPFCLPTTVPNDMASRPLKSVIIAAEDNYGGSCYGLSAVRFVIRSLPPVLSGRRLAVSASSQYSDMQSVQHLIDGSGLSGVFHDNEGAAKTMWHTPERPTSKAPTPGLAPSPAWVRFDFVQPRRLDSILIWNHNQDGLTDRGFKKARVYGTTDGTTWYSLTASPVIELPRADGTASCEPYKLVIAATSRLFKSVVIAAESEDGNWGGSCYGLSAVRFVVRG